MILLTRENLKICAIALAISMVGFMVWTMVTLLQKDGEKYDQHLEILALHARIECLETIVEEYRENLRSMIEVYDRLYANSFHSGLHGRWIQRDIAMINEIENHLASLVPQIEEEYYVEQMD